MLKSLARFCKFIIEMKTTKNIGLVLSGGGFKGVAHIGVIQALEEAGIIPGFISGTSAGAIVGSLYAGGYSPEKIKDFFKKNLIHLDLRVLESLKTQTETTSYTRQLAVSLQIDFLRKRASKKKSTSIGQEMSVAQSWINEQHLII